MHLILLAAAEMSWLSYIWTCILVLIGVNMLILVHEWGHYIVARACGVRCDKFYIWFDAWGFRFFRFKWGDTEYGLGWLPLGGYVKMLGQEDNPAHMKEEIERARRQGLITDSGGGATPERSVATDPAAAAAAGASEKAPDKKEGEERPLSPDEVKKLQEALYAPDSYLSKNVFQRMAIISAGVIMNVVFAFVCAVVAYSIGVDKVACGVGGVTPGDAAWRAGLQTGDEIEAIAGRPVRMFDELRETVTLGDTSEGIAFTYRPVGAETTKTIRLNPSFNGLVQAVGIAPPLTTEVAGAVAASPADRTDPPVEPGDELLAVDGQSVDAYYQYFRAEAANPSRPLRLKFLCPEREEEAEASTEASRAVAPGESFTVEVAPRNVKWFGLRLQLGPITAIQDESPASRAGLQVGDRLQAVAGEKIDDAMRLPEKLRALALAQETTELEVLRGEETLALPVQLRVPNWYTQPTVTSPIELGAIGVTCEVVPTVERVAAGSPAEEAGIRPGSEIVAVTFLPLSEELMEKWDTRAGEKETVALDDGRYSWPYLFDVVQQLPPGADVDLHVRQPGSEKAEVLTLTPVAADDWFNPDRGFRFEPPTVFLQAKSPAEAIVLAADETGDALGMVVQFIRKVGRQVSIKATGGPVTIVSTAFQVARAGMSRYLLFLCLLSANLAVLNILPVPVLDGGHLVFLTYEAIRRKPPNENVQIILSYIGLVLLLTLMAWVLILDFGIISRY